jgi:hypothetical protein
MQQSQGEGREKERVPKASASWVSENWLPQRRRSETLDFSDLWELGRAKV